MLDDSLVLMVLVKDSLQINDGAAHPKIESLAFHLTLLHNHFIIYTINNIHPFGPIGGGGKIPGDDDELKKGISDG